MASYGRQCIWLPNDQMEMIRNFVNDYNAKHGVVLSMPDALIKILDEYDVMKDQERLSSEY